MSSSVEKDVSPIVNENGTGAGVGVEPPPPPPPHEDKMNSKQNIYILRTEKLYQLKKKEGIKPSFRYVLIKTRN